MLQRLSAESELNQQSYSDAVLNIVWVLVVLVIIIALIVFTIRFLGQKNRGWLRNRSIRTLGAIGLGQNKSLQVLEIGDSIYLVGVGEDVQLVDKVTDPDEVASILAAFEQDQTNPNHDMVPFLSNLMKRFRKTEEPSSVQGEDISSSFHEVFQQKLNRVSNRNQKAKELLQDEKNADRLMDK